MDFTKVSGHTILYAITAIVAVIVAIAARYACLVGGLDAGTANLVFVVVLAVEAVMYLLLVKSIISFVDSRLAKQSGKKPVANGVSIPTEESVHDRIVREKFEESIALFCEYTATVLGRHISADELERLNGYIKRYACEQPLEKAQPIKVLSHKIGNNDLYHFGWNLWNHFRANRIDKRQECAVEWLKAVFANLEAVYADPEDRGGAGPCSRRGPTRSSRAHRVIARSGRACPVSCSSRRRASYPRSSGSAYTAACTHPNHPFATLPCDECDQYRC